jgi:hypothetical protein
MLRPEYTQAGKTPSATARNDPPLPVFLQILELRSRSLKTVKPGRIIHQGKLEFGGTRGPFGNQIEIAPIVNLQER